ncbi:MAG: hypothetical protein ACOYX1_06780 [Acidobacteriota bacterium]
MSSQPPPQPSPAARNGLSWFDRFSFVIYVLFTLEVGLFLLIYPWIHPLWSQNFLFHLSPQWHPLFMSNYFRGAVSGLGVLNLYISAAHALRLKSVLFHR